MRIIILVTGSILLLVGVISMVTPIPGGTLLIAAGGAMVICSSKRAEKFIRICRSRFGLLNKALLWIETRLGERLSGPIRRTRPDG